MRWLTSRTHDELATVERVREAAVDELGARAAEDAYARGHLRAAWRLAGVVSDCPQATAAGADATPVDPLTPHPSLDSSGACQLAADLSCLDAVQLTRCFPRQRSGRLELGQRVLLSCYSGAEALGSARAHWLVAATARRRTDPQRIELGLVRCQGSRNRHRWDLLRYRWDRRERLDLSVWELDDAAARRESIARCLHTQATDVLAALKPFGVAWRADTQHLLEAEPLDAYAEFVADGHPGPASRHEDAARLHAEQLGSAYAVVVEAQLSLCMPWRFEAALAQVESGWLAAAAPRGGRPRRARLRLFALPKQHQRRRGAVFLERAVSGAPLLSLAFDGTERWCPPALWRRPLEFDLLRHGGAQVGHFS